MTLRNFTHGRARTVALGVAVLALAGTGSAVAGATIGSAQIKNNSITSYDIKDGTLQTRDLTKNNFARFTATEQVEAETTAASAVPAYAGAPVVDLAASPLDGSADITTDLVTVVLDKGTWAIDGTAQFWHLNGVGGPGSDYGVVTFSLPLENGFPAAYSPDVPDGGDNAGQVAFSGTVVITANDTPLVIRGALRGSIGQAGASVQATQIEYVKQPAN